MVTRTTRFDKALLKAANGSTIVAHYTKKETFLEYILPSYQLRLGRLSNTNDPRETKEWSFPSFRIDKKEHDDWVTQANGYLNSLLRDRCYVACGTLNQDRRMDCYLRPRMWAQYGDNHCGVCLLLSVDTLDAAVTAQLNANDKLYSRHVDYFDKFPFEVPVPAWNPIEQFVAQYLENDEHRNYFLFGKHPDWKQENEHRWIVVAESNRREPIYISLEDVLIGVVVGQDWPEEHFSMLKKKFPQSSGVILGQADWLYMEGPQVRCRFGENDL